MLQPLHPHPHPNPNEARKRIVEHTTIARPPLCPEIAMRLITPATPLWRASEEEAARLGITDPYWAFCWAGGQALARYVLDHGNVVAGRRVLDFGCGGAIVGIAAALTGGEVLCSDIDPLALVATHENAALNGVQLRTTAKDVVGRTDLDCDVVLAGDVTYEAPLAARVVTWLARLADSGVTVLLGDPGRGFLDPGALTSVAVYDAPADNDPGQSFCVRTTVYGFKS